MCSEYVSIVNVFRLRFYSECVQNTYLFWLCSDYVSIKDDKNCIVLIIYVLISSLWNLTTLFWNKRIKKYNIEANFELTISKAI